MAGLYDPIKAITPVDIDGNVLGPTITEVPVPSSYDYTRIDISAPDAGNTEDMKTHKMRQGQKVRIDLVWAYPNIQIASQILKMFNSEYAKINYLDAQEGVWQDRIFYIGDRKAPLYNSANGKWTSVSFPIIQQTPDLITS